ncbi:helix-turn-helix transcriptional regulator [Nesterenkonia sp. PF2B19]|uniref:helix-turn-helix transcriptional regulator n=1 Tax=Nesterenkonia sp. PF2B19 TaxID=1881858 RepID=UPI000A19CE42|nr:helix-turn-helix transcriptional regulator [Nesterenkonia sp. PF2B19]OSM43343.1 hypothetical protein BCY76_008765 [Nesterenkonia sp. PF2B19]
MSRAGSAIVPGGASLSSWEAQRRQAQEHWQSCPAPALLVEGEHGLAPERMVHQIARRTETHLVEIHDLHRLPRLGDLSDLGDLGDLEGLQHVGDLADAEAARAEAPTTALLLRDITRQPPAHLEAVDAVLRAGAVPVAVTARPGPEYGHRFVRAAGQGRGLRLRIRPQTFHDTARTLAEMLGAPPTAALARLMHQHSQGRILELENLVAIGTAEGWIVDSAGRAAVARLPAWTDRRTRSLVVDRLAAAVGSDGLEVMRRLARRGPRELEELLHGDQPPEAVFALEAEGLVRLTGRTASLTHALHRHALREPGASAGNPTGRDVAGPGGTAQDEGHDALVAAAALLGAGEITAMHVALLSADGSGTGEPCPPEPGAGRPPGMVAEALDSRVRCLSAAALAATGEMHAALALLGPPHADVRSASLPGTLHAFIRWGLLQDRMGRPHHLGTGSETGLAGRLRSFHDGGPRECLRRFSPPARRPAEDSSRGGEQILPDLDARRLERCVALALEAYAAAQLDECARARESLAELEAIGEPSVPVVCLSWVTDRMGVARTLLDLSLPTVPGAFRDRQPPERMLLTAQAAGAVELFAEVARGTPPEELRERLDDLWSQFEAEGPIGHVTRKHLEALDFLVDGDRSRQLQGPPGASVALVGESLADPWVTVIVELARLLHAPVEELTATLRARGRRTEALPGVRRLMVRCVALRRGHDLPRTALVELRRACRRLDVETELVDLLTAHLADDDAAKDEAEEHLRRRRPHLRPRLEGSGLGPGGPVWTQARMLLSPREQEIVELLLRGLSSADVADRAGISVRTVQTHVRHVYRKLRVTSRTELRARLISRSTP